MQITIGWMEQWFDTFNRDYFGSALPRPLFKVSKSRTRLGAMSCKRIMRPGKLRFYDFTIHLSNYYEQTERQFHNVLLHEMIHYSIAYSGLKDTAPHGVVFRGMMDALNRKYGWEIRVTSSMRGVQTAAVPRQQERLVFAAELTSGEHVLTVVNPRYACQLDRQACRTKVFQRYGWYQSADAYFHDFPQVRSLRARRVSTDIYEDKLSTMKQIFL